MPAASPLPTPAAPTDAELLRRYDRPGPRYTSYPTAPQFKPGFDAAQLREAAHAGNGDPIPRALSLYVHVPFCSSPCFYCGCNRIITRSPERGEAYLACLLREIALTAPLFDRDRAVVQLHLGGGTPNFLTATQLGLLVTTLRRHFSFSTRDDRDISIELDPRGMDAGDIADLARIGFNRASIGIQDFDPAVQAAVNRVQGVDETAAIIRACRDHGLRSVNVDLIYGLPLQNLEGFARTLEAVIGMRPDRLAIYGYAHMPQLFKAQRQIASEQLPSPALRLALLQLAIDTLTAAGYVYIGMDHFALPGDSLAVAQANGSLHRNFMGYTTHADSDLVGLGVSAISHIADTYSQSPRDVPTWQAAVDAGRLPVCRGMRLDDDDCLRAEVIGALMCQGVIDVAAVARRHGIDFDAYFADALLRLQPLLDDGLATRTATRIAATPRGRLLVRNIAMCFDRYLDNDQARAFNTVAPLPLHAPAI